ncbi:MAG TPA: globin [Tepidisphaeraceae bacterium]|nr:globin [Tepidisphaeraceae bacterium]
MDLLDTQVFGIIGEAGFTRLVAAFYRRVPDDDILGPLYPKPDMIGAERRLRQFLIQRFGGPDHYSQTRGHPRLRARHARFKVDPAARDRWVKLMHEALEEVQLPPSAIPALRQFFNEASTFLLNHPGPAGPEAGDG